MIFDVLVSGLERDKFDNRSVSFEDHLRLEHNMWHYLFFIVLVNVKDSTEFTGPESYVHSMIKVTFLVYIIIILLSSQSFCDSRNNYLSLCLSVCLSVLLLKPISR